jgi:Flp pilus assembly protein TadG
MIAVPRGSDRPAPARRRGGRAGSAAVEFALVCSAFLLICFGVVELGLLLWTQQALQSAAAKTARCVTLAATACANAQQYAVTTATTLSFTGVTAAGNVWVGQNVTCASKKGSAPPGKYTVVTISTNFWATGLLPPPLSTKAFTVSACYPSAV